MKVPTAPYLYIDNTKDILPSYLLEQNICGMFVYDKDQKKNIFYGKLLPNSEKQFGLENNSDICSLGKLFTVVSSYLSLKEMSKHIELHPQIVEKLPPYIRIQITKGTDGKFYLPFTVEDLIFHKAGIGNYLANLEKQEQIPQLQQDTNLFDLMHILEKELNMDAKKGEFSYSNTGYFLLGLAIETAINPGKNPEDEDWISYYQFVHDSFLYPADMTNTTFIPNENTIKNFGNFLSPKQPPTTSAGGYYSSSEDLYKFMEWVKKLYQSDENFKKFIQKYSSEHPLFGSKNGDFFMHLGVGPQQYSLAKLD